MRMLIDVWLARWQASLINGLFAIIGRLLGTLLEPVTFAAHDPAIHPTANRPEHHHTAEEHAVPGLWMMAPWVTTALWLTSVVVALAHHLHISRRADSAVESHQFGRISGP